MRRRRQATRRSSRHQQSPVLEPLESLVLLSAVQVGTPDYYGTVANWAYSPAPTVNADGSLSGGIQKFVDSLPGLTSAGENDLGQYLPVAIPDQFSYPGSDYYEIAVIQYTEKMSTDLAPTTLRGYVQIETPVNATFTDASGNPVSKHIPLFYPDNSPIRDHNGIQVYAFDQPSYLGPEIVAERNVPVRVKYDNYLPTGDDGNLFLPVDTTVHGIRCGPHPVDADRPGRHLAQRKVLDHQPDGSADEYQRRGERRTERLHADGVQRLLPHHRDDQRPENHHR